MTKTDVYRCPECGAIDWGSYPTLKGTLELIEHQERMTSRHLAQVEDISIQAASNRLARLLDAGLLYVVEERAVPGGGTEQVFAVYPPDEPDVKDGGLPLPPLYDGFQWVIRDGLLIAEETEPLRQPLKGPKRKVFVDLNDFCRSRGAEKEAPQ